MARAVSASGWLARTRSSISVMPSVKRLVSMAAARLTCQAVSRRDWTSWVSLAPLGWYSSKKAWEWRWYAARSSEGRTMVWPVRPWRKALREERCLPASVRGPVDFWALARLIEARSAARALGRSSPLGTTESDILYNLL